MEPGSEGTGDGAKVGANPVGLVGLVDGLRLGVERETGVADPWRA